MLPVLGVLAAAGVFAACCLMAYVSKTDPIREVMRGVRAYESRTSPDPAGAARHFARVLGYYPADTAVRLYLAHSLADARDYTGALKEYSLVTGNLSASREWKAIARTGMGAMAYLRADYKSAERHFSGASDLWPGYAEPNARLALADLHLGKPNDAITAANAAIRDGYKGPLAQVALAQAYAASGAAKKSAQAAEAVRKADPDLARRLAAAPGGWDSAAASLTRRDLRMPLAVPTVGPRKR
jgi:hypothetical protein